MCEGLFHSEVLCFEIPCANGHPVAGLNVMLRIGKQHEIDFPGDRLARGHPERPHLGGGGNVELCAGVLVKQQRLAVWFRQHGSLGGVQHPVAKIHHVAAARQEDARDSDTPSPLQVLSGRADAFGALRVALGILGRTQQTDQTDRQADRQSQPSPDATTD